MEHSGGENREEKPGSGLLFLVTVFVLGGAAWLFPGTFAQGRGAIPWLLGAAMLGMGLTLTMEDFRRILERPRMALAGTALQFGIMPLAGFLVAKAMGLPPELAVGVVLVGSCPGGTASNVVSYLAKADVALSVTLTAISTILAPLATPAFVYLLAGEWVEVSFLSLVQQVAAIVLGPVVAGVLIGTFFPRAVGKILPALPFLTSLVIALIIAIIVGGAKPQIGAAALPVALAVVFHNALGLALGYGGARAIGASGAEKRTIAIEVGMQNSGLAVALAIQSFSPAAALPGALFSVWHNVSGALLAAWWGRKSKPLPALPR
ncbi:MAG: bile acid:sodium symporter family protein [Bdellovibrionota bacterium]